MDDAGCGRSVAPGDVARIPLLIRYPPLGLIVIVITAPDGRVQPGRLSRALIGGPASATKLTEFGGSPESGSGGTVDETHRRTFDDYRQKGLAARCGFGTRPVLLIVDFINGFIDPSSPLGGPLGHEIQETGKLLEAFRRAGLSVVYTTIAYRPDLRDAGMWIRKVPALETLKKGTRMVEVDARIRPLVGETVIEKKQAAAFFGTDLDAELRSRGIDTIVMTGCTTSGCIRASAIDSIQHGYHTAVVADAVGDRAHGPHQANLFDIDAKYGDVISTNEALDYIASVTTSGGFASEADTTFRQWWSQANRAEG